MRNIDDEQVLEFKSRAVGLEIHGVFIPKSHRKAPYGELRRHLAEALRKLAAQKKSRIEAGHLMPDHVPMMIAIPPKYAASQVAGPVKGKSAIHPARVYAERRRNFVGSISGLADISSRP